MKAKRLILFTIMFTLIIVASLIATILGINKPQTDVRPLGKYYLKHSYYPNREFINQTPLSPETVTSIVWDYRGLDTVYEVTVFFLAIVGGLTLFRLEKVKVFPPSNIVGMTTIVKHATKLLGVMIIAVSASIALHGHLTPGGGFQGGAALAVFPLLVIPAYSRYVLEKYGLTYLKAVIIRSISLILLWIVIVLPIIHGFQLMQNQPFYPGYILDQLISGSLFLYNLLDYIAIGMGFTAVFLYLSIPEETYVKEFEGEAE